MWWKHKSIVIPQDSESPVGAAAGNPGISRLLISDSFVAQRSTLLMQNSLPEFEEYLWVCETSFQSLRYNI